MEELVRWDKLSCILLHEPYSLQDIEKYKNPKNDKT
jgi:hypothetical protein